MKISTAIKEQNPETLQKPFWQDHHKKVFLFSRQCAWSEGPYRWVNISKCVLCLCKHVRFNAL